jgi:hypothetical protein
VRTVAALFVATDGCYFGLPDVDPWDVRRDARLYAGPHPVVAHPPCQLWVNFAALNFKRYGGEHNRPGNDGGSFASALASVREWCGVLEHPAGSNAWAAHIPMPVASLHRVLPPKERPGEICGTCAKKDRRVAVERLPSGEPTGLCAHHNRFEKELRRELKMASELGPLTAEKASEIYKSVARSMHLGDVGGEEDYVPAGHDRAWDPSTLQEMRAEVS